MSKISKDEMTILKPASEVKSIAESAEHDTELASVSYAINSAANTGQFEVPYCGGILGSVKEALIDNGYNLEKQVDAYQQDVDVTLISWRK